MKNTIILASTPSLSASLEFYQSLNFAHIVVDNIHYFTDGPYAIEVSENKKERSGLRVYKESWSTEVAHLRKLTVVKQTDSGYLLNDFSGIRLHLIEGDGPEFLSVTRHTSDLGRIAGMSLEGVEISHMNQIWKILGFQKTMGDEKGSWLSIANKEGFTISLMGVDSCPHMFYNPSLTYFNGKSNLDIIGNVRAKEIFITEEITEFNETGTVDNIIIQDPGGLGFFIFND